MLVRPQAHHHSRQLKPKRETNTHTIDLRTPRVISRCLHGRVQPGQSSSSGIYYLAGRTRKLTSPLLLKLETQTTQRYQCWVHVSMRMHGLPKKSHIDGGLFQTRFQTRYWWKITHIATLPPLLKANPSSLSLVARKLMTCDAGSNWTLNGPTVVLAPVAIPMPRNNNGNCTIALLNRGYDNKY